MKRLIFIVFATVLMAGTALAQDKPVKGSWSTEVQINPFEQNGNTFSLDGLKVRYFLSDKDALRLKVSFSSTKDKYTDEDFDDESESSQSEYKDEFDYKKGHFSIDLGYERHFDLGKRLNAYAGVSFGLGKNFASTNVSSYSKTTYSGNRDLSKVEKNSSIKLKNGAFTSEDFEEWDDAERASFNINGALFAGLEFYVYKGLYLGTELGLGCQSAKTLKMKLDGKAITKTTENGRTTTDETVINEETTDNYRVTNFNLYVEPKLRIGITF